jgi:hypothetical protein
VSSASDAGKAPGSAEEAKRSIGSLATLRNQGLLVAIDGDAGQFRIERHFLISLMERRIARIKFDEIWYLSKYPDVREAVKKGAVPSGHEHYLRAGYYEHRMPSAILVNEGWYLQAYPDVADAVKRGVYRSGQAHFEIAGFREGRIPYANFQL